MKLFSKSKEIEMLKNNLKIMQERNKDLYKRDIEHQEFAKKRFQAYKEEIAKLKIEIEDLQGFLKQEKQVTAALRHQRNTLRKKMAELKKGEEDGE